MTREEQLDWLCRLRSEIYVYMPKEWLTPMKNALDMTIKELEQRSTTKNDLGVDCISRTQAIERLKLNFPISQGADNSRDRHRYMQALADLQAIRELPSVTPQKPKIVPIAEIKLDEDKLKSRIVTDLYSVIKQNYIEREVLDKIIAEIKEWYWQADKQELAKDPCVVDAMIDLFIRTIDKYKAESEGKE